MRECDTRRNAKRERMRQIAPLMDGLLVKTENAIDMLQTLLRPGDRIFMEGDNQKQADFLARALNEVDPGVVHDLIC